MRYADVIVLGGCLACGPSLPVGESGGVAGSEGVGSSSTAMSSASGSSSEASAPTTGSTTTGSATTGSDVTSTDEGFDCAHNFVFECDVPAAECDVWLQDCPPGQKCSAYGQPASEYTKWSTRCVPVAADPVGLGEPCSVEPEVFDHGPGYSGIDDCGADAKCWYGICVPICTGSADDPVCPPEYACEAMSHDHENEEDELVQLCVRRCDPLVVDCAPGEVCVHGDYSFFCAADVSGDEGQRYDLCEQLGGCDPGLVCEFWEGSNGCDPNQLGCCLPVCNAEIDPNPVCDADNGEICVPYVGHVGVCIMPP